MIIKEFNPARGINGKKHRLENNFRTEVSIIAGRDKKLFCPVTLRAYQTKGRLSFCLWIGDGGTLAASGSDIGSNYTNNIDATLRNTLERAGFTVEGNFDSYTISGKMEAVVKMIGDYLSPKQRWVNHYVHLAHG